MLKLVRANTMIFCLGKKVFYRKEVFLLELISRSPVLLILDSDLLLSISYKINWIYLDFTPFTHLIIFENMKIWNIWSYNQAKLIF